MEVQSFASVWDALCDTPDEAAHMTMRSELLLALQGRVRAWGTEQEDAERLGITRRRLADLMRGKIGRFSLGALVDLATRAGLRVKIRVSDGA